MSRVWPSLDEHGLAAILLVAGIGKRLGGGVTLPKVLLEFGGKTLLQRHLDALQINDIRAISLTVGHREDAIRGEIAKLGLTGEIRCVHNPRFKEGSLVSLWTQSDLLRSGREVILMDGDVLYPPAMLTRLREAPGENILLVDRNIEPGDEPVKICFKDGLIVDFRKKPEHAHDWHGESVGFFRFSPAMAAKLADRCQAYVDAGRTDVEYEEAIRDLILAEPQRFAAHDISDLPWTEIDFETDVAKAEQQILPLL